MALNLVRGLLEYLINIVDRCFNVFVFVCGFIMVVVLVLSVCVSKFVVMLVYCIVLNW